MGLVAITHAITNANAKPSSFTTSSVWNLGCLGRLLSDLWIG